MEDHPLRLRQIEEKTNKINNGCPIDLRFSPHHYHYHHHKVRWTKQAHRRNKSLFNYFRPKSRRRLHYLKVSEKILCKYNLINICSRGYFIENYKQALIHPAHLLSSSASFCLLLISILSALLLVLQAPILTSGELYKSTTSQQQQLQNKYSSQFSISQLCAGKSQFPVTKRVEGALLSSNADLDVNCTITFRTKSAQQHFIIRFEELKLGCDDHLKMFDGDLDYGQPSIKDFSCRDNLASVPILKTTGTYLTIRYSTDSKTKQDDGFRFVLTAVFDINKLECPHDYTVCHNFLCISRSLICDDVNHCLDNSDEIDCSSRSGSSFGLGGSSGGSGGNLLASNPSGNGGSLFAASGDTSLSYAFVLLIVLAVISICVTICVSALCCRRESHYTQYQHHLQRAIGVPLQTSSSLMFANHPQQYHYFQPANISPFITPQHQLQLQQHQHHQQLAAAGATLPRGYSTLPLNLPAMRQQQQHHQQQPPMIAAKAIPNEEFLMMAGMGSVATANNIAHNNAPGPPGAHTMQTNLFLPTSQSILTTAAMANNVAGHHQLRFPPPHQPPGR